MSDVEQQVCEHCGTEFDVPNGIVVRVESTRDMPPPARLCAWGWKEGQRRPDFENDLVLHECRRGVSVDGEELDHEVGTCRPSCSPSCFKAKIGTVGVTLPPAFRAAR